MAPPTTNSPTIIITTELENPDRASWGVSIPVSSRATRAHNATRSERTLPMAKNTAERTKIMMVVVMCFLFLSILTTKIMQIED